jgi:hypothetical protein
MRKQIVAGLALGLLLPLRGGAGQQTIQLPARDRILAEKPQLLFTIGAEEGEHWELLSGVRALAFDAHERLYVLDSKNFRVLVFDSAGKFVRQVGKKGDGPGELMLPTGMTVMTDGRLVVSDVGRRAYSLFSSDGRFLTNYLWGDGDGPSGREGGMRAHPRSGVIAPMFRPRPRPEAPGARTGERRVPVLWVDFPATGSSATHVGQLYEFVLPAITRKVEALAGGGSRVTTMQANWSPPMTVDALPDGGIVEAHEARYRLSVLSPTGKVERNIERAIAPRKGTQKDKDAWVKREAEELSRAAGQSRAGPSGPTGGVATPDRAVLEALVRGATWLEVIPVLRRIATDPQGRIWVGRMPADFGIYGPIDIVRDNGTYIGTILNAVVPAAVSKSGRAGFIERDELGVERVTVKRVPTTWQ